MNAESVSLVNLEETFLAIVGVGLWLPGCSGAVGLKSLVEAGVFPRQAEVEPPGGRSIEPRGRRRASHLSRALADACAEAIAQAELDATQVATVFGSTLGEAHTMISLLGQMWRKEEMSPMGFATSVHSAASGVVSISAGNRAFTTSLSADYDTVAAALTEGWGVAQTTGLPAIVVCGDDHSPADFVAEEDGFDLLAVGLALCPGEMARAADLHVLGELSLPYLMTGSEAPLAPVACSAQVGRNPQAGLLDVVWHLLEGHQGVVRLDRGQGSGQLVTLR